ncbi:MAG: Ig-like domain-containing protein [Saprospiraceae bacterium]|nr:Ig-like domain-containing protein [Saprospiraceae bacterium]
MILRLFVLLLCLSSCARVLPPEGGEKDTTPPILQKKLSTLDRQTDFRPTIIRLVFDEWIQLKDVLKEVVISPPVKNNPVVTAEGKSAVVTFNKDEPWKDSTTYTLYFGKAIQDRNEGNVAPDLRFVFSTGPVVDSLSASGQLIHAQTGEPYPDALIILHRSFQDSAITLQLPDYVARTDKQGQYHLENVRAGVYRMFGLAEKSTNYLYDLPDEWIGWYPEVLRIDSLTTILPTLRLSPPRKAFRVINADSTSIRGSLALAFSKPPNSFRLLSEAATPPLPQWLGDTLIRLWSTEEITGSILLNEVDTIRFHLFPDTLTPLPIVRQAKPGKLTPGQPILFVAPVPLSRIDSSLVQVWRDSTLLSFSAFRRSTYGDSLTLHGINAEGVALRLYLLPHALTSAHGRSNVDTLIIPVSMGTKAELVQLRLLIDSLPPGDQVILEIMNGSSRIGKWIHSGDSRWELSIPGLLPANYQVFLTRDENRNGFWDAADYYRRAPAELRSVFPLTGLRANWEMDIPIIPQWPAVPAN